MFDLQVQRLTRICAQSGRTLQPGEPVYSTIVLEEGSLVRRDYSADVWAELVQQGVTREVLAWWRAVVPGGRKAKPQWAPRDVLLDYFDRLEDCPQQQDTRYVLALLLLRRRILRDPQEETTDAGQRIMKLTCPSRDTTVTVQVQPPAEDRLADIQAELSKLLDGVSD